MATPAAQAAQSWHHALKLRKLMMKQLEKVKEGGPDVDLAHFEAIDKVLEKFRLACVQTIFLDIEFAASEDADHVLWTAHTSANTQYRNTLSALKQPSQAVEKRKVEKSYDNFLRIAQKFYKGYVQRLAARYDIPDLKRIACDIHVEPLASDDMISPVPDDLYNKVLTSCYKTVIALGDLTRYRNFSRPKKSGYDTALVFYNLARDLIPDAGHAYAQMGVLDLAREGKMLDVVYYCYRSCAVAQPHGPGKHNLEAKFKGLLQQHTSSRRGPPSPHDAFIMWFARLHAHFYQGKIFTQHAELEGEVMHRLDMASKSADSADMLLKMTLINISAYHVASDKFTNLQSAAASPNSEACQNASRFCQYTLRLNARFIETFCRALESELDDLANRIDDGTESTTAITTTPVLEALLPITRIYMMWLAGRRHEIFGSAAAFGGVVPSMVKALARVFTLLFAQMSAQDNPAFCPYLLKEDIIIRGMKPLSTDEVPRPCQCYVGDDGNPKPELKSEKQRLESFREASARILDILRSAWFLREDPAVPLVSQNTEKRKGGANILVFKYQEIINREQEASITNPRVATPPTYKPMQRHTEDMQLSTPGPMPAFEIPPSHQPAVSELPATPSRVKVGEQLVTNGPDHAENTVREMLTDFMTPPTPQARQASKSPQESSYGMHTATANEVFANLQPEANPNGSIPRGKFGQLPWDWIFTPKPNQAQDLASPASKAAFTGELSPSYPPQGGIQAGRAQDDVFTSPGRQQPPPGLTPRSAGTMFGSPQNQNTEETHRNQLLRSFMNTSAPRTSVFSSWGQNASLQPKGTVSSSWGLQDLNGHPLSSGTSAFSHPSSLYQGTPANGASYGRPTTGQLPPGLANGANSSSQDQNTSTGKHFQMDETASSYNAAILQSAFYGNS